MTPKAETLHEVLDIMNALDGNGTYEGTASDWQELREVLCEMLICEATNTGGSNDADSM